MFVHILQYPYRIVLPGKMRKVGEKNDQNVLCAPRELASFTKSLLPSRRRRRFRRCVVGRIHDGAMKVILVRRILWNANVLFTLSATLIQCKSKKKYIC